MDGGVAIPNMPPQGFFQMPRPQVPHFQRPRFHPPFQNMPQPNMTAQSNSAPTSDTQKATTPASSTTNTIQMSGNDLASLQFDGKRMRKAVVRKTVDYNTSVVKYLENRIWQRDHRDARAIQPDSLYQLDMVPPAYYKHKPMNCLTTKFMRQSTNKFRCPIFCLAWTPEGRRLVTGASSGEFTLWNGLTFSFETILQAHETSVRAMVWSHNDQWMVTGDHAGFIKYWQSNMNNVKMYQGHKEAIRGIRWERVPSSGKTDHGSKVSVTSPKGSESVIIPDFFMFKIGSMVMALGVVLFDLLLAALNKCRVILFSVIMIESSSGSFLFDKKYTFLVQRGFTMNLSIFHRIGKVS